MIAEKETEQEISVLEGRINALKEGSGSVKQDANVTKLRIGSSGRGIPKEVEQYEVIMIPFIAVYEKVLLDSFSNIFTFSFRHFSLNMVVYKVGGMIMIMEHF